jgi:hypothetical protein
LSGNKPVYPSGDTRQSLSEKKLKQIAGRCRNGLISETVIYDLPIEEEKRNKTTFENLIKTAKRELNALQCLKVQYFNDKYLKENYEKVRKLMIENTELSEHRFIR